MMAMRNMRVCTAALLVAAMLGLASAQNFSLPTLPYEYEVMEPSIDNYTMFIHWNRHAMAFITNLNNALAANCSELQGEGLAELVAAVGEEGALPTQCATLFRNNAGGLFNHLLFFLHNLAPWGSQTYDADASPELKAAVDSAFGSYDNFKSRFSTAAAGVFGSGWAWLVADPTTGAVNVTTSPNQDNPLMYSNGTQFPLLGLDVWEHGYYLKYQNRRPEYIGNFTDVINWQGVSDIYSKVVSNEPVDVATPAANFAEAK